MVQKSSGTPARQWIKSIRFLTVNAPLPFKELNTSYLPQETEFMHLNDENVSYWYFLLPDLFFIT
jgi:hypothetical protein